MKLNLLFRREYANKNNCMALRYDFFVLQNIFFIEVLLDSHIFYRKDRIIYQAIPKSTKVKSIKIVTKNIFLPSFHWLKRASLFFGKLVQCYKKNHKEHIWFYAWLPEVTSIDSWFLSLDKPETYEIYLHLLICFYW